MYLNTVFKYKVFKYCPSLSIGNIIKKYYLKLLVFSVCSQKDKHFQCFIQELESLGSQGDA